MGKMTVQFLIFLFLKPKPNQNHNLLEMEKSR